MFGESYFDRTALLSLSSPYNYTGDKTKEEILKILSEAIDFALGQISFQQGVENLHTILEEQSFNDECEFSMNQFLVYDILVTDYVFSKYGITGTDFKSAICAYDLISGSELDAQMKKVSEGLSRKRQE